MGMKSEKCVRLIVGIVVFFSVVSARADLFTITAQSSLITSFNTNTIVASGKSLVPLVQSVINSTGAFGKLGQNYSATLRYANIPNALNITVTSGSTGLVARIT